MQYLFNLPLFVSQFFCTPTSGPDFAGVGEAIYTTANGNHISKYISNGKIVSEGLHESLVPNSKISIIPFLLFHNSILNIAEIHLFYCIMNNLKSIVKNFL